MRIKSRVHAFKLVFQLPYHVDCEGELDLNEIYINYKEHFSNHSDEEKEFIYTEFKGTCQNVKEIDEIIEKHLQNWRLERLEREVLGVLRLATYELLYTDTPKKVIVNEGVRIIKKYSINEKNPQFINGMLYNISKEIRGEENECI
ncbi:MAG: transcription antitermination factor NusB [Lachnospirales bacterium]